MLRFKSLHTPRVSNSLAVLAAFMLLVSALSGTSDSVKTSKTSADQALEINSVPEQMLASESVDGKTRKKDKGFKVSLFLFRID